MSDVALHREYRRRVPDGEFHARTVRAIASGLMLGFEWHGGEYIEVCRCTDGGMFGTVKEVINVWDPEADGPKFARTEAGLAEAVDRWIDGYGWEALVHDVTENWRWM